MYASSLRVEAPLAQIPTEHLQSGNPKDKEEEDQDDDRVSEQGDGEDDGLHQDFDAFHAGDGAQGPEHAEGAQAAQLEVEGAQD